jgi:hypothetical protein
MSKNGIIEYLANYYKAIDQANDNAPIASQAIHHHVEL